VDARYSGRESPPLTETPPTAGGRATLGRRAAIAIATATLAMLALAAPASAITETFNYTGAAQTWTVPLWVTEATFDLYGAQGGETGGCCNPGLGGRATATIAVTPRDSIQVKVGGQGSFTGGGFNGGGSGSISGGGGASDIRTGALGLTDRVLVAGGGGGDGGCITEGSGEAADGGDGGGLVGADAATPPCLANVNVRGVAGGGGTQTMGGSATSPATPGTFGTGGSNTSLGVTSGGGGGGWWGGGAGLSGGGGGGGSGHGPDGTTYQTGVRMGDGLVTVTYAEPTVATLIESVKDLDLTRSVENSLRTPLNAAQQDVEGGDTAGACTQLAAFINQVQLYGGGQIDPVDADALIFEANAVQESLDCGPAVAACAGQEATIVGSGRPDRLRGTNRDDVIVAGGGDDRVVALRGDDLICAARGADVIQGRGGDDVVRAGAGDDRVAAGGGDDELHGKGGEDSLTGGTGDDLHKGGAGDDRMRGLGGDDKLRGGAGDDVHRGGGGADDCRGGGGSDSRSDC
jgi:Ca2+-binding RTX toxin-like protein